MKLTKTQLKEIIREEIQKLSSNKSLRLKPIKENWILSEDGETVVNPKTKRKIKVSSALSYPQDHPAYKLAVKSSKGDSGNETPSKLPTSKSGTTKEKKPIGLSKGKDNVVVRNLENLIGTEIEQERKTQKIAKGYTTNTIEFSPKNGPFALSIEGDNISDEFTVKIKDRGFNNPKGYAVEFVNGEDNAIKLAMKLMKKHGKKYFGMK